MMDVLAAMKDTVALAIEQRTMPLDGDLGQKHLEEMLIKMRTEEEFSYGKLCRWLGWAQAAVVASGGASLEDMKKINKRWAD